MRVCVQEGGKPRLHEKSGWGRRRKDPGRGEDDVLLASPSPPPAPPALARGITGRRRSGLFELWDRSCLSFRLQREPGILPRRQRPARRLNTGAAASLPWLARGSGVPPLYRMPTPLQAGSAACCWVMKTAAAWRAAAAAGPGTPSPATRPRPSLPPASWARAGGCCWTWPSSVPWSGQKSR